MNSRGLRLASQRPAHRFCCMLQTNECHSRCCARRSWRPTIISHKLCNQKVTYTPVRRSPSCERNPKNSAISAGPKFPFSHNVVNARSAPSLNADCFLCHPAGCQRRFNNGTESRELTHQGLPHILHAPRTLPARLHPSHPTSPSVLPGKWRALAARLPRRAV